MVFYGHFCAHGQLMGQATSKGNEAKLNMKQPSDMPTEIRTWVFPLDHGGALSFIMELNPLQTIVCRKVHLLDKRCLY